MRTWATAIGAGLLIALSVPPAGWWPLGILGLAVLARVIGGQPARRRALIGFAAGMGLYGVTIFWFAEFNAIGAVFSMMVEAGFFALAFSAAISDVAYVAALVAAEWLRTHLPFGGVPLGGIAIGQAAGPLAPAARIGGPLLLTAVTAVIAVCVSRPRVWAIPALAIAVGLVAAGRVSPSGHVVGVARVAVVQGGGRRGLRAIHNSAQAVFDAQVKETEAIHDPVDLILWPEDVIALGGPVAGSTAGDAVGKIAAAHGATVLAGVTEDVGPEHFRNAEVVWDRTGRIIDRYDKVHRVPFGEYIPGRSLIRHIVNLDVIPRDAIAGHGSGAVKTDTGPVGVVISFEIFFSGRSRSAIGHGGQILLVPTNTASYTTTQVPAAEVASDRLRAWETGRDVVMAAPTGWSAVLDARGRLLQRTGLGTSQVLEASVPRRTGKTPYIRFGDWPWAALSLVVLALAWRSLDRPVNSGKP